MGDKFWNSTIFVKYLYWLSLLAAMPYWLPAAAGRRRRSVNNEVEVDHVNWLWTSSYLLTFVDQTSWMQMSVCLDSVNYSYLFPDNGKIDVKQLVTVIETVTDSKFLWNIFDYN